MKLDLHDTFNQLYIAEGDEWKTTFCTCYGYFDYQVIPFSLTNMPVLSKVILMKYYVNT